MFMLLVRVRQQVQACCLQQAILDILVLSPSKTLGDHRAIHETPPVLFGFAARVKVSMWS
jgi:hypothetical protein